MLQWKRKRGPGVGGDRAGASPKGPAGRGLSSSSQRGFTLVEVQVAIILTVVLLYTMGGHSRVVNQLLAGVQEDKRVSGIVDVASERASLSISDTGTGAGPPTCDVIIKSIDTSGTYPEVTVLVEQAGF